MKKNKNLKIVDFKKEKNKKEKSPDFLIEKLEEVLKRAKEGQLKTIILHYDSEEEAIEENEEDSLVGNTIIWSNIANGLELLGLSELIKFRTIELNMNGDD